MFIRKFYDTAVDEGGGEAAVAEPIQMSAAEAMAKHGSKSDENRVEAPVDINEKKEVEKPVEETTTAKVEETPIAEKPASETSQEKTEVLAEVPKVEEKQPIVAETPKAQTLAEVLKTNQPEQIFKALGFDDNKVALVSELKDIDPQMVGIIQAYKDGTLGDYVKELSTDYSKMTAEEVMRHQLRQEYPKATPKQIEALYKAEVVERYKIDPEIYSEEEVEYGRDLLDVKADKYRDTLIANQEKYLLPKPPEPKLAQPPDNSAELKAKENVETYVRTLTEDPYTKNIIADKKITLGEGEEKFSFPVDANALIDVLSNGEKWAETMFDETGAIKTEHQLLIATVAKYGKGFLDAYALHYKGLGGKEVIEPINNAKPPEKSTTSKSDPLPTNAAALMAKQGVRRTGG